MTQSLYYSKRNQKCCHQSQKRQTFVFTNRGSQINFLVKNWDCASVVRKNWFCERHSLFRRKSLTSLVLTGTLMHWIMFWVSYVLTETWVMLMLWFRLGSGAYRFFLIRHCSYGKLYSYLIFPTQPKYDTVFNALFNLANVANQLQQHCHPAFCNEEVFYIVTEIFLKQPEHLLNLVPMMDGFHMTKSPKHCVGKYLRGSGMEDAFVRNKNIWTKSCTVSKGRITLCQSFQGHVYCCRSSWVNEMGCLFECS